MKTVFKILNLLLLCTISLPLLAQHKVEGIVFDRDTKQRIAQVRIHNTFSGQTTFNNSRGEFEINVSRGDVLVAIKEGFHNDTIRVSDEKVLLFYMKRATIFISEVTVVARRSPEEILNQAKRDYSKAFGLAQPGSAFSVGPTGAGLNINTIYNLLSKEGKNARRLTAIIEEEYRQNIIDSKFTPDLVSNTTGLTDTLLRKFIERFRPSYYFVVAASDYQITEYIKSKYELFKLSPNLRHLPRLPKIEADINEK